LSQEAIIRYASLMQILTCSPVGLQYKDWWGNEACADCLAGFFLPTAGAKTSGACSSFVEKKMILWFYESLDAGVDLSITNDKVIGELTHNRMMMMMTFKCSYRNNNQPTAIYPLGTFDKGIAMEQATQLMSIMDANRDGKVSLTEFDRGARMKYLDSYGPTKFYPVSLDRTDFFQQNCWSYTKAFMKNDRDRNNLLTMQECLDAGFDFMTCYYYALWATNSTKSCQDMRGFVDSQGHGCDAWAKNPTWCEGSPEDGKFDPPSDYANEDGIDPGMACCECRRRQFCEDKPGFVDNQGEGCDVWAKNPTWCVGSPEDGVFDPPSDYAHGDGLEPSMACCACRKALGLHIGDQGGSRIAFDAIVQGNQHNPVIRMLTTLAEGCQPYSSLPSSLEWDIRSGRRVPGPQGDDSGRGSNCNCVFTQISCRSHGCTRVGWEHGEGCKSKVCEDMPGFFDSEGNGCDVWTKNPTWCEESPEDGNFDPPADYANEDGIDSVMACCICRSIQFCEALEAPVINVDRCHENFMHKKEKGDDSVESCSDPLLGGLLRCCYDVMLGDCKTCYSDGDCTKAPFYCAQKYLDACGAFASNKSVASESSHAHAGSCAVSPKDHTAAYLNHPGYVLSGRYKFTTHRSGIQSEHGCAEICGDLKACGDLDECIPCNSFIYISSERLCMFLVGQVEDVCVADFSGCVYTIQGLDGAITQRTPNGGPLWMFDDEGLYCAPNATVECECTREYFKYLLQNSCEGEDNQISSFKDMCSARGCSSDQCGLRWPKSSALASKCTTEQCGSCRPSCNATELRCIDEYMAFDNQISAQVHGVFDKEYCYCAAGVYTCMDHGACLVDEASIQHSKMCLAHNCTAAGASEKFNLCNQTNIECTDPFFKCQKERLDPGVDECVQNYKKGKGKEFCTLSSFGGIQGCIYEEQDDSCYSSGDCACSKDYFGCMKERCVEEEAIMEFAETCVHQGCSAAQCGLDHFSCNRTGLVCANAFLMCELGSTGEEVVVNTGEVVEQEIEDDKGEEVIIQPWCATSFCLRTYFQCMTSAKCIDEEDLKVHLDFCREAGCTPGQCGILPLSEEPQKPDAPRFIELISILGRKLDVVWQHSALALKWSKQGSKNSVLQYIMQLEACECLKATCVVYADYKCDTFIGISTLMFDDPRKVRFENLNIGTLYKTTIWAVNINGTSPIHGIAITRLSGPPKEPQDLTAERTRPRVAFVSWKLPLDTGDTTRDRPLTGYRLELTTSPSAKAVTFSLLQSTSTYEVTQTVGGQFTYCAAHGGTCKCGGVARFGIPGGWSPPKERLGSFKCQPSANFPDMVIGERERCECSSDAQVLVPGQNLSARVLAINIVGVGNYTLPSAVKIMGEPSVAQNVSTNETENYIEVTWVPPADTGFGVSDPSPPPIVAYTIYTTTCRDFDLSDLLCDVEYRSITLRADKLCTTTTPITLSSPNGTTTITPGVTTCSYRIQEAGISSKDQDPDKCVIGEDSNVCAYTSLQEQQVYYIKVTAENELGSGFLSLATSVRQTWKLFPKLIYPDWKFFPMLIVTFNGLNSIWIGDENIGEKLQIEVVNLPFAEIGSKLQVEFDTTPVKYGEVQVLMHTLYDPASTIYDPLGIGVITTLHFTPPPFSETDSFTTGKFFVPEYPSKFVYISCLDTRGQRKGDPCSYTFRPFQYPKPSISVNAFGRVGGGETVKITILEPTVGVTRYAAGLQNFVDAARSEITVRLGTSVATVLSKSVYPLNFTVSRVIVTVTSTTSPTGDEGTFPLGLSIAGASIDLVQQATYKYRASYLSTVSPRSALTTGGATVTLVIRDLVPLGTVQAGADVSFVLTIGDAACTSVAKDYIVYETGAGVGSDLKLTCRAGASSCSSSCPVQIRVTVPRVGMESKQVVGSDGSQAFSVVETSSTLFYYERPPDPKFQASSIEIVSSAQVPIRGKMFGADTVWVSISRSEFVRMKVDFLYVLDVTELSVRLGGGIGTIVSTVPSGSEFDVRQASTVITVKNPTNKGATCSSARSSCNLLTISVTYDGKTATSATIFEYKDTSRPKIVRLFPSEGGADEGTIVLAAVTGFGSVSGATFGTQAGTVLGAVPLNLWLNDPPDPIREQVAGGHVFSNFIPSMSSGIFRTLQGAIDQIQTEILEDSAVEAFTTWIVLHQSPRQASASYIDVQVMIEFLVPRSSAGTRTVTVYPKKLPTNVATTTFTYEDTSPKLKSAFPFRRYQSGGDEVTLEVEDFGSTDLVQSNAKIAVGKTEAPCTFASYDRTRKLSILKFTAPPMAVAGLYNLNVQFIPTGGVSRDDVKIKCIETPSGAAILTVSPSSGPSIGGFVVSCRLTNFQMLDGNFFSSVSDCVCNSVRQQGCYGNTYPIVGGWQLNILSTTDATFCMDVNQCTANGHNCFAAATFTNTPGSFACSFNTGYESVGQYNGVNCPPICGDGRAWPCRGSCVDAHRCDDGNTAPSDGCDATCQSEKGFECIDGNAGQSNTCRCNVWTKTQDGDTVIAAKYYSPKVGTTVSNCSRYFSTTVTGPFESWPEDSSRTGDLESEGDKICYFGKFETGDNESQGSCRCNRYHFRADCNTMVLPDEGRNEAKLGNIAQDQSLSALLNGQDTGIRVLFPANSLARGITVYLDVYADDKISDVAGALATGKTHVSNTVNLSPEGTYFLKPVTLTLPAALGQVPAQGQEFKINYFDKDNQVWEQIPPPPPLPPSPAGVQPRFTVVPPPAAPPSPDAGGGSPVGAIVGAIVGILVIGGAVAGYFRRKKNRLTSHIVPLRTGADGLEEPPLVAQLVVKREADKKERTEGEQERKFQEKAEEQRKDSNKIVDCSLQPDMAQSECCVCLDEVKSHAFVPCGHLCVCAGCAESIMSSLKKECPSCRCPAAHVIKIFQ
jgi:cysteine-rich repeat protein